MLTKGDERGIRPKRLVESLGIDKSTVSYHLSDLSSAGIVDSVKQGRSAQYSVDSFIMPLVQMRLEKEVEINV
jgi:DNA-binding transcriptional ArsR family regulator